jgi:hypothetical protein
MGDVVLIWNIESEVEFSTYEVERSTDGRSFNRVQIVNATGLTTSNH